MSFVNGEDANHAGQVFPEDFCASEGEPTTQISDRLDTLPRGHIARQESIMPRKVESHWDRSGGRWARLRNIPSKVPPDWPTLRGMRST